MASNADLIAAAQALGAKLGEEVETTDLTNKELVTLVSGLRERADTAARASDAEGSTAALVAQVQGLAEQLGTTVDTDGLSNEALTELVENLKVSVNEAAKADADIDAVNAAAEGAGENETAKEAKVEAVAEEAAKKPPYYLMPGKALTTIKRGILGPGDEIKPEDIAGGKTSLDKFVKSGHVGRG